MKFRQLSLFTDKDVERNPLCRVFINPSKKLILKFRMEVLFKYDNPANDHIGSFTKWNIKRHINGVNPIKIGKRYFYDKKTQQDD